MPAEKPRETERNLVLVFFVSMARMLPTPVDRPAKIVRNSAGQKFTSSIAILPKSSLKDKLLLGFAD
jgi:hypothetical protein